jgi:hypothetical protein
VPAYFILCSPSKVAIVRKDYTSAKVTTSDKFLDSANHYNDIDEWTEQEFEEWSEPTKDPLVISSRARKLAVYDASYHIKSVEDVKTMTQTWPVLNSLTTFGVIMSHERGTIDWGAWYQHRPIPSLEWRNGAVNIPPPHKSPKSPTYLENSELEG